MDNTDANTTLLLSILLRAKKDYEKNPKSRLNKMWPDFLESGILRSNNVDSEAAVWWVHEYISRTDHPDSISSMIFEDIHGKSPAQAESQSPLGYHRLKQY